MNEIQEPKSRSDLTERELAVLCQLAQGLTNKEIGERLSIGQETVKTHVSRVLNKLGTRSRTEAALYAWREGLVKGP